MNKQNKMISKFALIACLIFYWISIEVGCAAVEPQNESERQLVAQLTRQGLTDTEIENYVKVYHKYLGNNPSSLSLETRRNFLHERCQAFDLGDKSIKFSDAEAESAWKQLDEKASLREQIQFWLHGKTDKVYATKNACSLYLKAYDAAKDEEKPNAQALFA